LRNFKITLRAATTPAFRQNWRCPTKEPNDSQVRVASPQMLDLSTSALAPSVSAEQGFEPGWNHVNSQINTSRRQRQILNCYATGALPTAPISGTAFGMGDCNYNDAIVAEPIDDLKWELDDTTRLVSIVDMYETFGIVNNRRNRNINSNQKVACGPRTTFCVPIAGFSKLDCRVRVEINLHRVHRAWRTIVRESLTSFQSRQFRRQVRHYGG